MASELLNEILNDCEKMNKIMLEGISINKRVVEKIKSM